MHEISFPTFRYYVESYTKKINAGGSFDGKELIELFKKYEEPQSLKKLLEETNKLEELIKKEDWEIDNGTLNLIMKNHGRNNIRKLILIIKKGLE